MSRAPSFQLDKMDNDEYEITSFLREQDGPRRPGHRRRSASGHRDTGRFELVRRATHIMRRRPLLTFLVLAALTFTFGAVFFRAQPDFHLDMNEYIDWLKEQTGGSHPVAAAVQGPAKPPRQPSTDVLSYSCLEAWVARGALCLKIEGLERMRSHMSESKIDAVWTWVNGSDPRHRLARDFWTKQNVNTSIYEMVSPGGEELDARDETPGYNHDPLANKKNGKWFRDHDELKYSMRAVGMHLEGIRTMHVLATDFQHPFHAPHDDSVEVDYGEVGFTDLFETSDDESSGGMREGQWPQWLDHEKVLYRDGTPKKDVGVRIQHHWNTFHLPADAPENRTNWKNRVLPSFNSYAIESQIVNLEDLHEVFIYNNDDFFLNKPFSISDFHTPLYGPVYRMRPASGVNWDKNDTKSDPAGMAAQLHRAAWALGERFGYRRRPFIEHVTKSYSHPLLAEARMMFPAEFARSSEHRFRGLGQDVVAVFLTNHMNVERHREALLWSFLVARGDADGDGWVSRSELMDLLDFVGEGKINVDHHVLDVTEPRRTTLGGVSTVLDAVGMSEPQQTIYQYTSQDGYPYYRPAGESRGWPQVYAKSRYEKLCTLDFGRCLPEYFEGAEGIWADHLVKRFAFDWQDCGDCLIMQLVGLSGPRGMSAFLPDDNTFFPTMDNDRYHAAIAAGHPPTSEVSSATSPFHAFGALIDSAFGDSESVDGDASSEGLAPVAFLPMNKKWLPIDFSLANVQKVTEWPADRTRREFAMRLIQRYSYVAGNTPFFFSMLKNPNQALKDFKGIKNKRPALVCINDDIEEGREIIDEAFEKWLRKQYPKPLPFELPRPQTLDDADPLD